MWNQIKEGMYENFIQGSMYKWLFQGLKTTILLTIFALLLGIVIGFFVAVVRAYSEGTGRLKFFSFIGKVYVTIVRGTPMMIQLLIMNFVIFASAGVSRLFVGALAFGLNSGAYVSEIVRAGILGVEKGQMEAGRSLGLSFWQTMKKIVLPQAFKNVLPALVNEGISLLKETSIIGYIGMQDLTKGAMLIQSRTFNAFWPLLAAAFLYLLLVLLLTGGMHQLEKRLQTYER